MHEARHWYDCPAHAEVPHLMLRLSQAQDTLHVPQQGLAEMCLTGMGKLENPQSQSGNSYYHCPET